MADACRGAPDGSFGCFSQQMFELGEDLFDRVEIGAIGRQEEQPCAGSPDRGTNGSALVAAEIIQDDDVAWPMRVHRAVLRAGCDGFFLKLKCNSLYLT